MSLAAGTAGTASLSAGDPGSRVAARGSLMIYGAADLGRRLPDRTGDYLGARGGMDTAAVAGYAAAQRVMAALAR